MFRLSLLAAMLTLPLGVAWAEESLPTIVTYELKKEKADTRAASRNPRAFWIRQVVQRIEDKIARGPKDLKQPAVVQLAFVVARDGSLVSSAVTKSSGTLDLDKVALGMLEQAKPFPPMPAEISDAELTFALPIRFR